MGIRTNKALRRGIINALRALLEYTDNTNTNIKEIVFNNTKRIIQQYNRVLCKVTKNGHKHNKDKNI